MPMPVKCVLKNKNALIPESKPEALRIFHATSETKDLLLCIKFWATFLF